MEDMASPNLMSQLVAELAPQLSGKDIISSEAPPRWSSLHAPRPGVVVNAETELDVATTVKYCANKDIPFLAQAGGNGWAPFSLGPDGVLINLARMNQITFSEDKTRATIEGGCIIKDTIDKAYAAGALIATGNCNCVGTLGAMLGGGYGSLMGSHGFGVDTILSLRVVTADGRVHDVTASSDPDLFWGLRGAAPNLGIVTSAVVRSVPATEDNMMVAWAGAVIFTPDKLEHVAQAIQDLQLEPEMSVYLYFAPGGPPDNIPTVVVTPFLHRGTVETGHAAFASLYDIGPVADMTHVIPYNRWNAAVDQFCARGPRKPAYSAAVQSVKPAVWRQVWDKYVEFQSRPTAGRSGVMLEAFSLAHARQNPTRAAFPHRHANFNAIVIPCYEDAALDEEAEAFGRAVRQLWRDSADLPEHSTYVNFARGDENLEVVYGDSLARLREVKQRFDPDNRFNQWFNIK